MSDYLNILWLGAEKSKKGLFVPGGSVWHLSGDAIEEEGVMLLPNPTRMYDTPVLSFWQNGQYGRVFQGFGVDNRDTQLGFQIFSGYDGLPEDWRYTDSLFRRSWKYDRPGRLAFETENTYRFLELQKLSEPESYTGTIENGQDPFLWGDATVMLKAGGENPNFQGEPVVQERVCSGVSGSMTFTATNDGDMEMWCVWAVSSVHGGTKWVLPDPSLGCDEFAREDVDAHRTWPAPALQAGEHTVFTADPRVEFARSSIDTNPWARCDSQLFYPIPEHTQVQLTVSYTGAVAGDVCRLTYIPQYSLPFSEGYFEVWS
jgi:hypothetical protein